MATPIISQPSDSPKLFPPNDVEYVFFADPALEARLVEAHLIPYLRQKLAEAEQYLRRLKKQLPQQPA